MAGGRAGLLAAVKAYQDAVIKARLPQALCPALRIALPPAALLITAPPTAAWPEAGALPRPSFPPNLAAHRPAPLSEVLRCD
jgi:hypothetical protein